MNDAGVEARRLRLVRRPGRCVMRLSAFPAPGVARLAAHVHAGLDSASLRRASSTLIAEVNLDRKVSTCDTSIGTFP